MTAPLQERTTELEPVAHSSFGSVPPPTKTDSWTAIKAVVRRDITAIARSKAITLPMIMVPTLLLVILPLVVGLAARMRTSGIGDLLADFPPELVDPIVSRPPEEQLLLLVNGYLLAPLFLIVPLMVSAVIAADAFAGEKERRTLESLLHLPVSDRDLYVGKLLSAYLPALAVSWIGFLAFSLVANAVGWPVMHRIFVPTPLWLIMILWVAPAVAGLGLGIMVRVSARSNSTQEANQLGGAVILPLIFVVVGQATGLLLVGPKLAFLVGCVVWVVALWLNIRGAKRFTRDRMAAQA
ncbi:MAG: ABC transporter permease [Acidimicrobiales bacterium]|nr:ABC transporter permease [Acidimicrobiales bacterium]